MATLEPILTEFGCRSQFLHSELPDWLGLGRAENPTFKTVGKQK
jgi:hypothetical protein